MWVSGSPAWEPKLPFGEIDAVGEMGGEVDNTFDVRKTIGLKPRWRRRHLLPPLKHVMDTGHGLNCVNEANALCRRRAEGGPTLSPILVLYRKGGTNVSQSRHASLAQAHKPREAVSSSTSS